MIKSYHLQNIRTLLTEGFTNDELRRLCYDSPHFRSVYDQLAQETGKDKIIDHLLEYAERKLKLDLLLELVREVNPERYEQHQPYYKPTVYNTLDEIPEFMSEQEKSGTNISVVISGDVNGELTVGGNKNTLIQNNSGQIMIGSGIIHTIQVARSDIPETNLAIVQQSLSNLKVRIQTEVPPEKKVAALKRLDILEESLNAPQPDLEMMIVIKNWFAKNIVVLTEAVTNIITQIEMNR